MYKLISILVGVNVLLFQLHSTTAAPPMPLPIDPFSLDFSDPKAVFQAFKLWLWGPDGTITVQGTNQGPSLLSMMGFTSSGVVTINMVPLWSMFGFSFPKEGMQGVLVKANPLDACIDLEEPPSSYTSAEVNTLHQDEENSTLTSTTIVQNWFLLAEDGYCDYDTKIRNADWAGYSILIIRKGLDSVDDKGNPEHSTTIDINSTSLNIYTLTVEDNDGYNLGHYSYPAEYTANVQDLREMQWKNASVKLPSISVGSVAVVAAAAAAVYGVTKKVQKNKIEKAKAAYAKLEEAREQIAKNLPSEKWRSDAENMRTRCKWCHKRFDHDDEVTKLPCKHQFHKQCLVPRILRGHGYCPICQAEIHSAPTPEPEPPVEEQSTEQTPLIATTSKDTGPVKIKEGTIIDDGKVKRYHCHICEILGLALKDELDLVDELSKQVGTIQAGNYQYQIPSRHSSLAGSSTVSGSVTSLALTEEDTADEEVRRITSSNSEDFVQKLHDLVEKREPDIDKP